jgi:hypothetical protein
MRPVVAMPVAALLAARAGVTHVVSTGPDTYMVASHGTMGCSSGPAQKATAFEEATDYRQKLGKQMQPIDSRETQSGSGRIAAGRLTSSA